MTPPVLYLPGLQPGERAILGGAEARHAVVLRLAPGDRVDLVDGEGARASCTVLTCSPSTLALSVDAFEREPEPDPQIWVVQALPKDGELAVDLLTEIGADAIVPWQAERSVARWRADRAAKAHAKWAAAIQAAAKQSRRARWPVLAEPCDLVGVCRLVASADLAVVLEAGAELDAADLALPTRGRVLVMVGPEGGLTEAEREALAEAGANEVRLGPTVLRSAVAGAMAVAALSVATARWRGRIAP